MTHADIQPAKMRPLLAVLLLVLVVWLQPLAAGAADPGIDIRVTGTSETVFRYATDACDKDDIPDIPARAFRAADGEVHLVASHFVNRALVGPDLATLRHDCRVIYRGGANGDPTAFDDHAWLSSFYTADGRTIFALVHNEFHGHLRRDLCPSGKYMECWSNAVTAAISRDGGGSFQRAAPPGPLVAALPYRHRGDIGRPVGYFGPTNMLRRGDDIFVLISAESYEAQARGMCLLRTSAPEDPRAWRAWDGRDFTIRFVDPYRDDVGAPADHVCTPVGADRLVGSVTSIVRHSSGLYLATMVGRQVALADPAPRRVSGIFVATSPDLIVWSKPRLLWAVPVRSDKNCDDSFFVGYPALLDPASASRNFDTIGDTGLLFMTRFNQQNCTVGLNRDLIRVPVRLREDG